MKIQPAAIRCSIFVTFHGQRSCELSRATRLTKPKRNKSSRHVKRPVPAIRFIDRSSNSSHVCRKLDFYTVILKRAHTIGSFFLLKDTYLAIYYSTVLDPIAAVFPFSFFYLLSTDLLFFSPLLFLFLSPSLSLLFLHFSAAWLGEFFTELSVDSI